MSLPPGFLDELRSRTSLAQVVGRKVLWDQRKSNQGKGDLWAPCPFHHEKTASFHVDDRKGYYYCFGCHAKGDAISFVRETENVDFIEAVKILATEAGMPVPERDPEAQKKADRRSELADVMEMALRHFRLQLKTAAGTVARDYLQRRNLAEETQERFEIGFAPDAWQGLWDHLTGRGIAGQIILDAGLARPSRKGGTPYDTFRNRIIFPIRDPRGRCIAFGGRAMDPNDNAKYLNSPETALFDKSRTLYNHGLAREAAGKGQPLIVAEGYMDVIALAQAGFDAAVAPLGTAVTEHQLQMLWRIADEPVMALDGDTAGIRAAHRVIDLALPLLEAGKSLRFVLLPEGKDPDDLIRANGPAAFQKLMEEAGAMVGLLWQRETEGRVFDSPERRAALDKALRERIQLIRDPSIRSHYGQAIKDLRWQLFRKGAGRDDRPGHTRRDGYGTRRAGRGMPVPVAATPAAKSSLLVAAGETAQMQMRMAVILAALFTRPALAEEFETALEKLRCPDPDHARLRDLVLRHADAGAETLAAQVADAMGPDALDKLMALPHVAISPAVRRSGDPDVARMTIAEELAKIDAETGLSAEISEAAEDLGGLADEAVTWRLGQAAEARNRALRSQQDDKTEYELAENGLRLSKNELKQSRAIFESIDVTRGGKSRRSR